MSNFTTYLITWGADAITLPTPNEVSALAKAARTHRGELLALGPTHDSYEQDSRGVPAWLGVARFLEDQQARRWFDHAGAHLKGTTYVLPALARPPWWPAERESARPAWSQTLDPPSERLGLFNCVWSEITDFGTFVDYSEHFMWSVEHDGGAFLAKGPAPQVLAGGPGPQGAGLMGWPGDGVARRAWYAGETYRPYKQQRHASSKVTTASVIALDARLRGGFA